MDEEIVLEGDLHFGLDAEELTFHAWLYTDDTPDEDQLPLEQLLLELVRESTGLGGAHFPPLRRVRLSLEWLDAPTKRRWPAPPDAPPPASAPTSSAPQVD